MSDGQLGALFAALGVVGAALVKLVHWFSTKAVDRFLGGFDRVVKAMDENTAATREVAKAHAEYAQQVAVPLAVLSTKVDAIADWVHEHTPIEPAAAYQPPPRRDPPSERRRAAQEQRESTPTEIPRFDGKYHTRKRS